jgi:hypothetical protein
MQIGKISNSGNKRNQSVCFTGGWAMDVLTVYQASNTGVSPKPFAIG